jgi:hypothetical protein
MYDPADDEQTGVVPLHAIEQLPQVAASARFASHPFADEPSQSAKPGAQSIPQVMAVHEALAFAAVGHVVPHAPQFVGSIARSVSHPFAALLSQSANPVAHDEIVHVPEAHASVAWFPTHALSQRPQFIASSARDASHPSMMFPLQSWYPNTHVFVQLPPAHAVCAHAMSHAPQLRGSLSRLTHAAPQHARPAAHVPHVSESVAPSAPSTAPPSCVSSASAPSNPTSIASIGFASPSAGEPSARSAASPLIDASMSAPSVSARYRSRS